MTAETAQAMYRAEAAKAKEQIRAQKEAQREAARQARTAAQETARQAKADLQSARNRMGGYQNARISELRRRAGLPGADVASLGLTDEERALVSGEASPSGLPGTRAYATNVRGIVSSVSEPEESNGQPNQGRGSNIFRSIGRVLATLSLIGSSIRTVISLIKFFPDLAKQQRSELARVDPVIAQYQAQSMIANLQDRIIMARDPGMRSAYASFTQSEMGFLESTRQMRADTRKGVAHLGGLAYDRLGGYGLMYEGMTELLTNPLGGLQKMLLGFDVFSPFSGFGGNYRQYMAARLAAQGNTLRSIFIGDLVGMTGGRFSTNIAYPGRQQGEAWWNARP